MTIHTAAERDASPTACGSKHPPRALEKSAPSRCCTVAPRVCTAVAHTRAQALTQVLQRSLDEREQALAETAAAGVVERIDSRQGVPLEELERRSACRGDVCHLIRVTCLLDGVESVAA